MTPYDMPGHILLPPPNGRNSKLLPLKSTEQSTNLSGMKFSALSLRLSYLALGFQSRKPNEGNTSENSKPLIDFKNSSTSDKNSSWSLLFLPKATLAVIP
ncbi:hypothetical protein G4B88_016535 [Cannabis sativa]|uniref:Uncharacterized protein n=1 Tax=Cannabis sativa TaxID=3483 RepID=A0A7J6H7Z2_CANSA|nr:hypothetical protein G4B88_016535 [Cannabis sativa]